MAYEINPENATAEEIEVAKRSSPDKHQFIRLTAIQMLLKGFTRQEVSSALTCNNNTITQWVKQWNEGGIDALRSVKKPGRPRKLSEKHVADIKEFLLNPELAQETHWTLVKLHGYLKKNLMEQISYPTLCRYVHRLGFSQIVPRSWPEKQDQEEREKFIKMLKGMISESVNQVWFCDETGVVGDPRPRHRWSITGSHPRVPFTGAHIRQSIIGAVQPDSGELEALIVPEVDGKVFQVFLDQFAKATCNCDKHIFMVLDNASWHKSEKLNWHNITPAFLPPYSPDLNPIERLWASVKANFFADWFAKSHEDLTQRLVVAMEHFIDNHEDVSSICNV